MHASFSSALRFAQLGKFGRTTVAMCTAAMVWAATPPALAGEIEDTFSKHDASSTATVDHSAWDRLLKTYVKPAPDGLNRVDYAAFKSGGWDELRAYIKSLEATDVAGLARREQAAFWVNLYNAKTIDVVLDAYPVSSIKKINLGGSLFSAVAGGPWDADVTKVNGVELSLNDIEHEILRKLFRDPRIHYAVNCASVGCPNLSTKAYTGANIMDQFEEGAKAYVNNPRGAHVQGGQVTVSSIYTWFDEDFGGSEAGVLKHLMKYAEADLASALESAGDIDDYAYDWSLNDVR